MFKSKFANALTTMMIGALGIAAAQNKLSVGYGAEAGRMDPMLQKMCRRYCRDSLVITRNVESQEVLGKLGVPTELGTDTAGPSSRSAPNTAARCCAMPDGTARTPVLAVCPINPFWWPVKPSLAKWLAHSVAGAYKKSHYRTIYFHRSGARRGRGVRKISVRDGRRASKLTARRARVSRSGRHGDARSRCLRARGAKSSAARPFSLPTDSTCMSW